MSGLMENRWYRFAYEPLDSEIEGRYLGLLQEWSVPEDGFVDEGGPLRFHWFFCVQLEALVKVDPDYPEDFEEIAGPAAG